MAQCLKLKKITRISGSYGGDHKENYLLGSDAKLGLHFNPENVGSRFL
jgi:hypothetical protein